MSIYKIPISQKIPDLSTYTHKTIVIVNIASQCGFNQQLTELNQLLDPELNTVVIAFPCSQFHQHDATIDDNTQWCQTQFDAQYIIENEINVNGKSAHPLFIYLNHHAPGILGKRIGWNFTKFIIHPNEQHIKRFAPYDSVEKMTQYIKHTIK
ncbi:glutathione peroxidase [Candidatus Comchoanobacter bicostacola]|uniref:Glutathione peroxidase n=1 Tax=Candidatus Comchoanobacter bicostacola TaxID=2919598 RepID=A0ABY5DL21_9GAMM|nr:glutathione peroxidase [Candidatus Comchoanobacter bicostacola]UTC24936.1 glutathione peroxidase [Candidatus Comchoanobacter bicostacola]